MKRFLIALALFMGITSAQAQTEDTPWWLTIELTNNKFDYRFWEGIFDFGQLDNSGLRVGIERYINSSFDIEAGLSYGKLIYEDVYNGNLTDFDLRLVYKFDNGYIFKEDSKVAPYLFAGYGMAWHSNISGRLQYQEFEDGSYSMLPIGGGLKFKVAEDAEINARAAYKSSISQSPNYMQYAIGVSFSLGGEKDSDGDGVTNKEDACPEVAGPVENQGCPWPDTDGDGVLDKDDECPTEAGTLNGCPDKDRDGIKDSEDTCPDVAGVAAHNGCPDTDGDGVKDSEDQCPNQAGTLNGCPDSDGDGIKDSEDQCPNQAGTLNGCPDTDGDGVKDSDDQCPQTAGLTTNNGCPEVKEEVKKVLDLAVKSIQFNSGSDVLKQSSYASLNQVADLMAENDFNLSLSGYTDNTGREDSNLELSKRRANAVKQYLIDKGIDASRLAAEGYGIANPIADNNTRAGRAQNRRVELEIVFK